MAKHYKNKKDEGSDYYGKGQGNFANLPSEVEMKEYPKVYGNAESGYPDTLPEVDQNLKDSFTKTYKQHSDSLY